MCCFQAFFLIIKSHLFVLHSPFLLLLIDSGISIMNEYCHWEMFSLNPCFTNWKAMQSRHRFENNKTNFFFLSVETDGLLGVLSMDQHDLMLMSTLSHEKEQRKTDVFQRGSQKTDIVLLQWTDVYVIFLRGICNSVMTPFSSCTYFCVFR